MRVRLSDGAARARAAQAISGNMFPENPPPSYRGAVPRPGMSIAEFAPPKETKNRPSPARALRTAKEQVSEMMNEGRFAEARGRHFVALYVQLHESVYGVEPLELMQGDAWSGAASAADRMLKSEFRGNAPDMIEFVRWVWKRERAVEKKRRSDGGGNGRRIGWRLQFMQRHLLTDFRVEMSRQLGRSKRIG